MKCTGMLPLFLAIMPFWLLEGRNLQSPPGDNIVLECSPNPGEPIGQYIVAMMQDSRGNLWFGTLSKGVAIYDGTSLRYLTRDDGLVSNSVVSMVEDKDGTIWFGTHEGISKFDGKHFTNFTEKEGLCHFRVSDLFIDSKENFWVGTWGGLCQFDGKVFKEFALPIPEVDVKPNPDTRDWITGISEDSKGNIWIGREGYGAYKYNGAIFQHFTRKEGLNSNHVHAIEEDNEGNMWFGTRVAESDHPDPAKRKGPGGLNKYDGKKIMGFSDFPGLYEEDVYAVFKDSKGDLWISTLRNGVYKFDGVNFSNFSFEDPLQTKAVSQIIEDSEGDIWLGCAGGLYRIEGDKIIHITTNGPW